MKKFGLVGNPLGHSYSPLIHGELFKLHGFLNSYELYPTELLGVSFDETLSRLDGFNVTIPYKTDVIKYLDYTDEKVNLYNSCNTVLKKDGKFYGFNTDAFGFTLSLGFSGIELKGKKILILGSGGVSRMMVFESLLNGADVYISSRNIPKCREIEAEATVKTGKKITVIDGDFAKYAFDIVANGTPCGMFPNELSLPVKFSSLADIPFVFDTIYNPRETLLTRCARYFGNKAENGLTMLVAQAAEAQKHFCGLEYSADDIRAVAEKISVADFKLDKNIVLIGLPGCGKTTVGKILADILNLNYTDIDGKIEKQYGNITDIFKTQGEAYFRKIESQTVTEVASEKGNLISLGGGAVETAKTMHCLSEDKDNIILYIDVALDILLKRVSENSGRPLLEGNCEERLKTLAKRRESMYLKYCDFRVPVLKEQSPKLTALECIEKLCGF